MKLKQHCSIPMQPLAGKDAMPVLLDGLQYLKGAHWWLSAGTLLGFERDNGFIGWDTDLDIAVLGEFEPNLPKEYKLARTVHDDKGRCHQQAYLHEPSNIIFDIFHWYEHNETKYYTESEKGILTRDKELIDNLTEKEYLGHTFNVPRETDRYLTSWYKDWRVPRPNFKTTWK